MLRVAAGKSFLFPFSCNFVGVVFFFFRADLFFAGDVEVVSDVMAGSIRDLSSRFALRPGRGTVSFLLALRGSVLRVGGA